MHPRDRWRSVITAMTMSAIALGSFATGAQAAAFRLTFQAAPGPCVSGVSNRHDIRVRLLSAHGTLLATDDSVDFPSGDHFEACFGSRWLTAGRTLVATSPTSAAQFRFTIPDVSLRVDRVTDVVSGRTDAGRGLTLRVSRCSLLQRYQCPRVLTRHLTPSGTGSFRTDLTGALDVRGDDRFSVTSTSAQGHSWVWFEDAPYMFLTVGGGFVFGAIKPDQHATFRLTSGPGGSVLSTRSVTGDAGGSSYNFTFGAVMRAGRQVVSDLERDARVTLPSTTTTIAIEGANQVVHTRCLPDRPVAVSWDGPTGGVLAAADGNGRASVDLSLAESPGFRLSHGSLLEVMCATRAGDIIDALETVP